MLKAPRLDFNIIPNTLVNVRVRCWRACDGEVFATECHVAGEVTWIFEDSICRTLESAEDEARTTLEQRAAVERAIQLRAAE
jgi:hypothetical protein